MEFYNVRKRQKVNVPDDNLKKTSFKARGATRYAVRAVDDDGTKLTKFVNKQTWDSLNVPEEKWFLSKKPATRLKNILNYLFK